jgi:hypothetical protein
VVTENGSAPREIERQLPGLETRAAEKERERGDWLEQTLGGQGGYFRDRQIPDRELEQAARSLVGGKALERAARELERSQERHTRAERELDAHRFETGYRRGLEWAFHALSDLNREKRLSIRERQAALELDSARERHRELDLWLQEPAQQRLIGERVQGLRQHDRGLLHDLQRERDVLVRGRELQLELTRCPGQERELKLEVHSLEIRELLRDESLQRTVGTMRELRLSREHELARGREIERRGIRPLREFQRDPQYGRDRNAADSAWARHAAEKGLAMEHIRDELLKEHQRTRQPGHLRELERITQLAEREVKRARGRERDRGIGWSR